MEVHLPKSPMHSARDFLKEVGIIVLGVLLALGAEQSAEALHWRHQIESAEDAMRIELRDDDGVQAYGRLAIARCLDGALARMDSGAAYGASAASLEALADRYDPPIRVWDEEAWKAVVASDVGTHMTTLRMVGWSAAYRLMQVATNLNAAETDHAGDLHRSLPSSPTGAQLMNYRRTVVQLRLINGELAAISQILLGRMHVLGVDVPFAERRALIDEAERRYGRCVVEPRLVPESDLSQFAGDADFRAFGQEGGVPVSSSAAGTH